MTRSSTETRSIQLLAEVLVTVAVRASATTARATPAVRPRRVRYCRCEHAPMTKPRVVIRRSGTQEHLADARTSPALAGGQGSTSTQTLPAASPQGNAPPALSASTILDFHRPGRRPGQSIRPP